MLHRFDVRFVNAPGIADSDWLTVAPGITVLTGRNNVGKSRILSLIRDLPATFSNASSTPAAPQLRLATDRLEITADLRGSPPPALYEVRIGERTISTTWTTEGAQWQLRLQAPGEPAQLHYSGPPPTAAAAEALPERQEIADLINRIVYLTPQRIIAATVQTAPIDVPSNTGADLGQAIYKHRNAVTPQFAEFEAAITEILPEVTMVLTDPISANQVTIKLRDRYAGFDVPIDQAGTGVNQLLHLIATILFMPDRRLLLIDEPQLHLHPGAEKLLANFIRRHSEHDYVMATHSPLFINALAPDHSWLLSRDERGTHLQSVFDERLSRGHVLEEIGLSPGDIVLAERILFVEGPADVDIYPNLMRQLDWDPIRLGCSVLELKGSDTARPLRNVIDELTNLLNMRMLILLDGDRVGDIQETGVTRLLPVADIETLLMRDSGAVKMAFAEVLAEETPEGFHIPEWDTAWPPERIAQFIQDRSAEKPGRKGAGILNDLAREMGELTYRKTVHGPRIAAHISAEYIQELRPILSDLLTN